MAAKCPASQSTPIYNVMMPGKSLEYLEKVYYPSPGGPFQSKQDEGKRGENTEGEKNQEGRRTGLMSCSVWES